MKLFQLPQLVSPSLTRKERIELIRNIGRKARTEFEEKYLTIERWFKEYDPLYLLSFCACYFISTPEGVDPEVKGKMDFYHHYLEIMQAFALYEERSCSGKPLFQDAERLQKEMLEIGRLMQMRWVNIPDDAMSDEEISAYRLRTDMMSQTAAVRNWAYIHQMKRVAFDLADLIGPAFETVYGFKAIDFLQLLWDLTEERNDLLNEHISKIRTCAKKKNYREIIEAYNEAFPQNKKIDEEETEHLWDYVGRKRKSLIALLVCHADLHLEDVYSFSFDHAEFLCKEAINAAILQSTLSGLALRFGDLKEFNKDYIVLDNPVLDKPFIELDDNKFYSAIWGIMPHLLLDILEAFVWKDEQLREKYTQIKSKYLEDEIERLFTVGFPDALIYRGSVWRDPVLKKEFENDLLVVIDGFAVVVEGKSGSLSDPARRGAPDRLSKTLRELIEEPSEQALRFASFLQENRGLHSFPTRRGTANVVDSSRIKYFIPLGVTLSHLGTIGSNLKKLIEARITDKNLEELAPSINVTDLESVFELLPFEAEKIHYLARRREFEAHMEYEGDELDLLGFYLDNGFNIGDHEYSRDVVINIGLKSKELDPYFVGMNDGFSVLKPELSMTKWWKDLLNGLHERKTEGWLETCFVLLNTTKEDQEQFERMMEKLKSRIRKGRLEKPHNWVILLSGPERRRYAIIGYPYTTSDKELRNSIIAEILESADAKQVRGAVVIGVNITTDHYPYTVVARRMSTDLFDTLTLPTKADIPS